jgi:thiamine biosynthesis lipoprotein
MKKERKEKILIFLILLFLAIFAWWFKALPKPYSYETFLFDTVVKFKIYGKGNSEKEVKKTLSYLRQLEKKMNYFDSQSELSKLNREKKVNASSELKEVIVLSRKAFNDTKGHFDISIAPLMDLWDFAHGGRLPEKEEIKEALKYVNGKEISIKENKIRLEKNVKIDLGGISKGYAVDKAVNLLQRKTPAGLVSFRSTVKVWGRKPGGESWMIGLENPRNQKEILATIKLKDGESLSTSGDYQKFFIKNGVRYHHILNPENGYPARYYQSLTVIFKGKASLADAYSTALFTLPKEECKKIAKELKLGLLIVDRKGKVEIFNVKRGKIKILKEKGS